MYPSATEVEEGEKLIALILVVVESRPHMVLSPPTWESSCPTEAVQGICDQCQTVGAVLRRTQLSCIWP